MKIGILIPPNYPAAVIEATLSHPAADHLDSVWFSDHLLGIFPPALWEEFPVAEVIPDTDAFMDPFAMCAWAAHLCHAPTGVAVTDAIRRAAPDVARSSLTLQHLCAGGFNIGVGSGEAENLTPFGYDFSKPVAATENFLRLLRHLIDTGSMPEGPGRLGYPAACSNGKPQIWVAGHRPRMLRLTGEYADGWIPFEVSDPDHYRQMKGVVHDHAHRAGRAGPEASLVAYTILGESRNRLLELFDEQPLAKLLALAVSPSADWEKRGLKHPLTSGHRAYLDYIPHDHDPLVLRKIASEIPASLLAERVLLGNANEVAQRVAEFHAAGCEHFIMLNMTGIVGGLAEVVERSDDLLDFVQLIRKIS